MIETERKFVILIPDMECVRAERNYTESNIEQIYLSDSELTRRVRKREYLNGECEYTENTKKRISRMSAIENERRITKEEYNFLSKDIEDGAKPLLKKRVTFYYNGKTVEIDIYPSRQMMAILEVELRREDEDIKLPEYIKVIKEVTGNKAYSNHSMAHNFPSEFI
jgi:CYTH domain-containing protein